MNKGKFPFSNLKINTEAKMNCWLTKINMMLYLSKSGSFLSNCSTGKKISSTKESMNILMPFFK